MNVNPNKRFELIAVLLFVAFAFFVGCASKPTPDPLEGFHWSSLVNLDNNKTISDDYRNYIQTLSPDEQKSIAYIEYFEDGTGQHAVRITIGLNHTNWEHVLIYDKDNKRIKSVKYISGGSMS